MSSSATDHRFSIPLLQLTGGSKNARVHLLRLLLPLLEEQSISTLVAWRTKGSAVPALRAGEALYGGESFSYVPAEKDTTNELFPLSRKFKSEYDLILLVDLDSYRTSPITLLDPTEQQKKPLYFMPSGADCSLLLNYIYSWLIEKSRTIPVWGCLLIGGLSSRMGKPKHLLTDKRGITWAEKLTEKLAAVTGEVILCGRGDVPDSLADMVRLTDIVGAQGPLAGILAAMRWNPDVSWLVCACDMVQTDQTALQWLLEMRRPGVWGSVPYSLQAKRLEPLLAHYDPRCRNLFETMLEEGKMRISEIGNFAKIETVAVPPDLATSWRNYNTPADLANLP